jgi:hypothetical protein
MVQDSNRYEEILTYVNMALAEATTEVMLPEFKCAGTVSTAVDAPFVALQIQPDRYVAGIVKLFGAAMADVKIYLSLDDMIVSESIEDVLTTGDAVVAVAVEGSNLWYYPIPTTPVTFAFIYYTTHPKLVDVSDSVTLFPDYIQRLAICAKAASMCFDKVEDGVDGEKVNTTAYELKGKEGIQKLHEWVGKNRRHFISSTWGE